MNFDNFNFILDFILIGAALWMMMVVIKNFGGLIGKAFKFLVAGAVLMGVAHIAETVLLRFVSWEFGVQEFIHRLVVLVAFILLIKAFNDLKGMVKAV